MPASLSNPIQDKALQEAERRIADWKKRGDPSIPLNLTALSLNTLPESLGQLTALELLYLDHNRLSNLPESIGQLTALRGLYLSYNQLSTLPESIGKLTALTDLYLYENQLSNLPESIGKPSVLRNLAIWGNPLPEELMKLSGGRYGVGTKLLKYLRALQNPTLGNGITKGGVSARRFDEAKVLFVGPGEVGKTWLLQALQGKVPTKVASTTGIEILREPLEVEHPSHGGRMLHLNCWDFGGQDHYQVTHQIFFSAKAIYLLVWKPRMGLDPDLVDRLERIQLSAGRTAKVLIVSTHAGGPVPAVIGKDELRERFGDLIWGFYETDSALGPKGKGIAELKAEIAKAVAQLEGMDLPFPEAWHEAQVKARKQKEPAMKFQEFAKVCATCGLDADTASTVAGLMEVQGHAVYFSDADEDARVDLAGDHLVVLNPEWLAKAVGFVITDQPTMNASGILEHARLKTIWKKDTKRDCPGYAASLHRYLLWLMWRFDIAYKQDARTSLVPQHIQRNRPNGLYWTPTQPPQEPEATLICRIPHNPPMGLIPALTAAVHPLRAQREPTDTDKLDRNWRDGFFLHTQHRGDAFVELRDRDLRLVVRNKYPRSLLDKVLDTLGEVVLVRWPQLLLEHHVPCIGKKNDKPCPGTHLRSWLEKNRGQQIECSRCERKDLDVDKMLDGFDPRVKAAMDQLRRLKVGQREQLAMAHSFFKGIGPERNERERAPSMFTILPEDGRWFNVATHNSVRVTCWCEHPDGPHPGAPIGSNEPPDYLLTMPKDWLKKIGPYISWSAMLMKAFVPVVGTIYNETVGQLPEMDLKDQIALMNDAAKALPTGKLELGERAELEDRHRSRPEIVALKHLHDFLDEKVKKANRWGDLRPVLTKSGELLWLCARHAEIQQPSPQEI